MTDLAALGLTTSSSLMLIGAPDAAMAEAAGMRPRPSFASSIMTSEPAEAIVWWLVPEELTAVAARKLDWLVQAGHGTAWLVVEEGGPLPERGLALEAASSIDGRPVFVLRG